MTDDAALIEAIRLHPDEDVPRLMYADFIQEWEPERAEFIRSQINGNQWDGSRWKIARAVIGESVAAMMEYINGFDKPSRQITVYRRRGIGHQFELVVQAGYTQHTLTPDGSQYMAKEGCVIRRGFVRAVTCPAADWLVHADAILAAHPVQEVTLTTLPLFFYETPDSKWIDTTDRDWGVASHREIVGMIETKCRYRWPTVKTWNLPPAQSTYADFASVTGAELYRAVVERYRNDVMRAVGLPADLLNPNGEPTLADQIRRRMDRDGEVFIDPRTGGIIDPQSLRQIHGLPDVVE